MAAPKKDSSTPAASAGVDYSHEDEADTRERIHAQFEAVVADLHDRIWQDAA